VAAITATIRIPPIGGGPKCTGTASRCRLSRPTTPKLPREIISTAKNTWVTRAVGRAPSSKGTAAKQIQNTVTPRTTIGGAA
jgi:hypothetical protein